MILNLSWWKRNRKTVRSRMICSSTAPGLCWWINRAGYAVGPMTKDTCTRISTRKTRPRSRKFLPPSNNCWKRNNYEHLRFAGRQWLTEQLEHHFSDRRIHFYQKEKHERASELHDRRVYHLHAFSGVL